MLFLWWGGCSLSWKLLLLLLVMARQFLCLFCARKCAKQTLGTHSYIYTQTHLGTCTLTYAHTCVHSWRCQMAQAKTGVETILHMIGKDDYNNFYCWSSLRHLSFWWRNPVTNGKTGCHQGLRTCWNPSIRIIRVQRRNVSAGRDSSTLMVCMKACLSLSYI